MGRGGYALPFVLIATGAIIPAIGLYLWMWMGETILLFIGTVFVAIPLIAVGVSLMKKAGEA